MRQFGYKASIDRSIKALLRPIIRIEKFIVLAIIQHKPVVYSIDSEITFLTKDVAQKAYAANQLNVHHFKVVRKHLQEDCQGFAAFNDNKLTGYAFIQQSGVYNYGQRGKFNIPENVMVLKNLFVMPEYRGQSIGKKLNEARINFIPKGYIPVGFVVRDNKYALRNLKQLGFKTLLDITSITFLKKRIKHKTYIYTSNTKTKELINILLAGINK